jgi:hypothetical protein
LLHLLIEFIEFVSIAGTIETEPLMIAKGQTLSQLERAPDSCFHQMEGILTVGQGEPGTLG